jgi:hypothetical protein
MMQFWTYFWRFRQCQLNFMPLASALHAAVAFSRASLSALDIFAASAGVGTNAMPLTSTVAIMPAIKVVAKWYMDDYCRQQGLGMSGLRCSPPQRKQQTPTKSFGQFKCSVAQV